jgi:hypothetical protein
MQLSLVILIAAVVALNVFALWYGSDSRDGDDWINHRA